MTAKGSSKGKKKILKIPSPRFKLISDVPGDSAEAKWSSSCFIEGLCCRRLRTARDRGAGGAPRGGGPRVGVSTQCKARAILGAPCECPHPWPPWWHLHNHLYMPIGMKKPSFSPIPGARHWALVGKEMFGA